MRLRGLRERWVNVRRWCVEHPLTVTLAILALASGPVYARSEAIDRERAADLAEREAIRAADLAAEALDGCRQRNSIQVRTRAKFDALIDATEELVPSRVAAIARLRMIVGTPQGEDRDCDGDDRLTVDDYTPYDVPDDLEKSGEAVI